MEFQLQQITRMTIRAIIKDFREGGYLDENFSKQRSVQENRNSMATFFGDTGPKLLTIEKILHDENINNVDFPGVVAIMAQIKINAARVGAKRVAAACAGLQQCCRANDVGRSKDACKKVTQEYNFLRGYFDYIDSLQIDLRFPEQNFRKPFANL